MVKKIAVFWFRRDLRINDNHGFYQALNSEFPVLPVFVFDTVILDKLNAKDDARVSFIYREIQKLKLSFEKKGSSLKVFHGTPLDAFKQLIKEFKIAVVFTNRDYEPYANKRDKEIRSFLVKEGIEFHSFKDHVIFEENEVVKNNDKAYTIYTLYQRNWKKALEKMEILNYPSEEYLDGLFKVFPFNFPGLTELGFRKSEIDFPPKHVSRDIIRNYEEVRDLPAIRGTTRIGMHLRFGTVSIRDVIGTAQELSDVFLNELIWREFFMSILWHFPHVTEKAFKPKYDFIQWRNDENEFDQWCRGETGYPLVDAGMREMNETGFMHNRVRMVTASFLTKHLLIDWRWGEAYFAEKLLDFELASNNGNWQWAAGTGCDAAPYFRIFNPEAQQKKFDPENKYILKWVPEFGTDQYVKPIVEHKFARARAMNAYKTALKESDE